jgi:methylated-DNA-[protein]-cysteine S-methyltransferase
MDTPTTTLIHRTVDSPIGTLLLIAGPRGLRRVAFETEGHDDVLAAADAAPATGSGLDWTARQLDDWFAGHRRSFELRLDLDAVPPFRRRVLDHLAAAVPFGTTTTYACIATALRQPTAVRAVGTACATNPLPIVLPCHRVLRTDGRLGGFLGGLPAKQALLDLEQHRAAA